MRLNQKGTIDIYYRVNDGYAGWDVASPQATLESGAAFTIPWKGGESLLPSVAGGINFGPEWEVTVDFNCSPDFKELLGISSPLAPPAKRQRFDDASSSDARKKCAECGEEGGPEAKFCSQCGHRFDNSTDVEVISFTLDGEEADDGQRVLGSLRGLVPQFVFSVRGFRVAVLGWRGGGS